MTASYQEIANLIRIRFRDTVAASNPTMIVTYDNAPAQSQGRALASIVRVIVTSDRSTMLGDSTQFRVRGKLQVTTSIPIELGDKQLWEIADQIKTAFRRKSVPPLLFQDTTTNPLGRMGDRWAHVVEVNFRADGQV